MPRREPRIAGWRSEDVAWQPPDGWDCRQDAHDGVGRQGTGQHSGGSLRDDGAIGHRLHSMTELQVMALPMGEFIFPADEEYAGQTGVVVAYAVRHDRGVFLFDTGFGFGNDELDTYYGVCARALPEVLAGQGVDEAEITAIANCHL